MLRAARRVATAGAAALQHGVAVCRYGKAIDRLLRQRLIGAGLDEPLEHRPRLRSDQELKSKSFLR